MKSLVLCVVMILGFGACVADEGEPAAASETSQSLSDFCAAVQSPTLDRQCLGATPGSPCTASRPGSPVVRGQCAGIGELPPRDDPFDPPVRRLVCICTAGPRTDF